MTRISASNWLGHSWRFFGHRGAVCSCGIDPLENLGDGGHASILKDDTDIG